MTGTYEIKCVDSIVSEWKRLGVHLEKAIEMALKAIENSINYEMPCDWNDDTLMYMIENWESIK